MDFSSGTTLVELPTTFKSENEIPFPEVHDPLNVGKKFRVLRLSKDDLLSFVATNSYHKFTSQFLQKNQVPS